ncbi:MAG: FIST C-terminal domain-containing protein [Synergistaceae bacterium]|nr:FIST C-terminal domain-containing protein [Synergistaceae bacterium]
MLKCASVFTCEIDDPGIALTEIMAQLDEKITLLKHSVGIVMCHPEFIATGVLKHICENLPFDLAGITNASQAVNDEVDELILTIFVMTSDDVWFRTGVTDSLNEGVDEPTRIAYEKSAVGESSPPKLALIFPPFFFRQNAGDVYVKVWEKIIPGTPFFGTLATDDTVSFKECETIYNGMNKKDAMPFVLCYGNINPRFLIATLPENSAMSLNAKITKSNNNIVYEINHINARKFFTDANFSENLIIVPLKMNLFKREDYDGVPVVRSVASYTEEGAAIFFGDVDEGSTFSLLNFEYDDILSTSSREIGRINELSDVNGALLFSCVIRRMVLMGAGRLLSELEIANNLIKTDIPFMMGYAGGEICPTSINNGIPTNRFHNYSLVILVV